MTVQEIKSNILKWIKTGVPKNVKSANVRTLLTWITKRIDVQETGRLRIVKFSGNTSIDLEISDRVTGIVEDTFIQNAIYLGGNINLLTSFFVFSATSGNNTDTENTYQNINGTSQLLDDQENQTQGRLQFVIDASDDPTVESGNAVYYFLGSENASISDYIKLSNDEVAGINPTTAATTTSQVTTESTFEVFPGVSNQNQYNVANAAAILRQEHIGSIRA